MYCVVVVNFVGIVGCFSKKCSVLFDVVCHGIWDVVDGTLA